MGVSSQWAQPWASLASPVTSDCGDLNAWLRPAFPQVAALTQHLLPVLEPLGGGTKGLPTTFGSAENLLGLCSARSLNSLTFPVSGFFFCGRLTPAFPWRRLSRRAQVLMAARQLVTQGRPEGSARPRHGPRGGRTSSRPGVAPRRTSEEARAGRRAALPFGRGPCGRPGVSGSRGLELLPGPRRAWLRSEASSRGSAVDPAAWEGRRSAGEAVCH